MPGRIYEAPLPETNENGTPLHKILLVDAERCTGCEICESVCSMVHDWEFNPLNSRIHRIRIEPIINTSITCVSCTQPDCVGSCPLKAVSKDGASGLISIDTKICDGCGACTRACPFGAIVVHTKENKAIVCDLCKSTAFDGPQCVEYCPKQAIFIRAIDPDVNENRFTSIVKIIKQGFPGVPDGMLLN